MTRELAKLIILAQASSDVGKGIACLYKVSRKRPSTAIRPRICRSMIRCVTCPGTPVGISTFTSAKTRNSRAIQQWFEPLPFYYIKRKGQQKLTLVNGP